MKYRNGIIHAHLAFGENALSPRDHAKPGPPADEFISENEAKARALQADWIASGHTGICPAALTAFGNALHTITDRTSPAHAGNQPWHGLNGITNLAFALAHVIREFETTRAERNRAEAAARAAFQETFGDEFELKAIKHQRGCTTVMGPQGPITQCW